MDNSDDIEVKIVYTSKEKFLSMTPLVNRFKTTTYYNIHYYVMKIYIKLCIESIQDVFIALELYGYFVHVCQLVPSIELALVCLILVNKLYEDRGLRISDIIKYCDNIRYVYELEVEVLLLYYRMKSSPINIIGKLYKSLKLTENNSLLEAIVQNYFSVNVVKMIIEYGGSVNIPEIHKAQERVIEEWLLKIKEEYIYTIMRNKYHVLDNDFTHINEKTLHYMSEIRNWYKAIREKISLHNEDESDGSDESGSDESGNERSGSDESESDGSESDSESENDGSDGDDGSESDGSESDGDDGKESDRSESKSGSKNKGKSKEMKFEPECNYIKTKSKSNPSESDFEFELVERRISLTGI